jgi:predicted aspartyl protease
MIYGWFDEEGKLWFEVELVDASGIPLAIDAILDGEITLNVYTGKLIFDGEEFDVLVTASEANEDYLLGVPWLRKRRLVADMRTGVLTLGEAL